MCLYLFSKFEFGVISKIQQVIALSLAVQK